MNAWCEAVGIQVPSLEQVRGHREANNFALLLVALLERGEPMTLLEVAERFEEAGVAASGDALRSLKRCRPARAPVYREGDHYGLDPHDSELDFWAFRLDLRPPAWTRFAGPAATAEPPERQESPPVGPDVPLTPSELEEAFRDAWLTGWSALRVCMAVLDAHGPRLHGESVLAHLSALGTKHIIAHDSSTRWRRTAIAVEEGGLWCLDREHPSVPTMRKAVRARVEVERRRRAARPDPAILEEHRQRMDAEKREHAERLAAFRRAVVHVPPASQTGAPPSAVTFVDVATLEVTTLVGDEVRGAAGLLAGFDVLAGLDIRRTLRSLGVDPARLRVDELGPPQKSLTVGMPGRALKITTEMLITGSCRIPRPLTPPERLRRYAAQGPEAKLRSSLESDARSLTALYHFGRLHGGVRLRWRSVDEMFRVPWLHRDEPSLHALMKEAVETNVEMDVVVGAAEEWTNPWAGAIRCRVLDPPVWAPLILIEERGALVDPRDVCRARLSGRIVTPSYAGSGGRLRLLADSPVWEWPTVAEDWIVDILDDGAASADDRLLAAELAGYLPVLSHVGAAALFRVLGDPLLPEVLRAQAAITWGRILEEAENEGEEGGATLPVAPFLVRRVKTMLRALHEDPSVPLLVRRRALEAAARAPEAWQRDATHAAFRSQDPEWHRTAVFAMGYLGGFTAELLEALNSDDPTLVLEAVVAADRSGDAGAWPPVRRVLRDTAALTPAGLRALTDDQREIVLAAIEAASTLAPGEVTELLGDLADCDDPEIADAALDGIVAEDDFPEDQDDGPGPKPGWPLGFGLPGNGGGVTFH